MSTKNVIPEVSRIQVALFAEYLEDDPKRLDTVFNNLEYIQDDILEEILQLLESFLGTNVTLHVWQMKKA